MHNPKNDPFLGTDVQMDELRPPRRVEDIFAPTPDSPCTPPDPEPCELEQHPPADLKVPLSDDGTKLLDFLELEVFAEEVRQLLKRIK
jgi:hypothetical protein